MSTDPAVASRGTHPRFTASLLGRPIRPILMPFATAYFISAVLTDLAYRASADVQWSNFSVWLITGGLVVGGLGLAAGLVDLIGDRRVRGARPARLWLVLALSGLVVELVNAFVHSRDGWTAVVPTGLTLSIVGVVLLVVAGWFGGSLVYDHRIGVRS